MPVQLAALWPILRWVAAIAIGGSIVKDTGKFLGLIESDEAREMEHALAMGSLGKTTQAEASAKLLEWMQGNMAEAKEQLAADRTYQRNQIEIQRTHERGMLERQLAGQAVLSETEPAERAAMDVQVFSSPDRYDPNIPITALF